ncbi:hypothetical protein [Gordonia sp. NPDC003429]
MVAPPAVPGPPAGAGSGASGLGAGAPAAAVIAPPPPAANAPNQQAPPVPPATAPPAASPGVTLAGVGRFIADLGPAGLLLLGAVALLGSGSFLEALRSARV